MVDPQSFVEVMVRGLARDPESKRPILMLTDHGQRFALPVWIGAFEAGAIIAQLEGRRVHRPMTHDLLRQVVESLKGRVIRLDIRDLKKGVFYADLHLIDLAGVAHRLDCRPSDGIALALRTGATIRVATSVLRSAQLMPEQKRRPGDVIILAEDEAARARLVESFAEMSADDFKYET